MSDKSLFKDFLEDCQKIAAQHNISWRSAFIQWDLPANVKADFALTLSLPISHKNKQNPQKIAQEILANINCFDLAWNITEQGYINFRFSLAYCQDFLRKNFQAKGKNLRGDKKDVTINIEFVSANPTGYLHLAHFRQAVIGNVLANIYQFLGYDVVREYYINDRGVQITALINSIYYFYRQLQDSSFVSLEKVEYAGVSSQEVARKLIKKWGDKYLHEKLDGEVFEVWKKAVLEIILTRISQDLARCGIKFDNWFSEASLYENNKDQQLMKELAEKNLIYLQDGATFFRSSLKGDDKNRVIIKNDGDYTYFFSDILYHQDKLKRADRIIDVWGADHHGYIGRIKSACQLLGYETENIQIILVQTMSLLTKEGQFEKLSKRLGNTIELAEALQYLDADQLKFFLLEKEANQSFSINAELLKENKEKTRLYYIQYAYARCHQIFQKADERSINIISINIDLLSGEDERKIFNLLIRFPFVLESIVEESKIIHLINYLYELARSWQVYYQNSTILELEKSELTSQKLLLVKNIQIILKLGLNLLGIEAPERM